MNTTLKGDIFEKRVFDLIQELLNNDEYYLNARNSKIFSKKPYYSERRKGNIICDITIESYINNAEEYSSLNIIECKNLNKNVSVDDVEEFDSKIKQIGEHNTKGTLVTCVGFTKNAINLAKSLKIGLLKVKSDNQLEWINYRKVTQTYSNFENDDTEPFQGLIDYKVITNIADFLIAIKAIDLYKHKDKYITIPYLTEDKIDNIVKRLFNFDIHDNYCLNVEKLCSFIKSKYPVEFYFLKIEDRIMGKIEFEPLKIFVNNQLEEERFRYTLCHELGHLILHRKLLVNKIDKKEDDDFSLSLNYNINDATTRRIELQANIFASHLLLPLEQFRQEVGKYFIQENIRKGYIYLDKQPINQILSNQLISRLSKKFNASNTAVKIRLISLGLLKDTTDFSFRKLLKQLNRY